MQPRFSNVAAGLAAIAGRLPVPVLLDVPPIACREPFRKWLLAACDAADTIAELTTLRTDDAIVDLLRSWVDDPARFEAFHQAITAASAERFEVPSALWGDIEAAELRLCDVEARMRLYIAMGKQVGLI